MTTPKPCLPADPLVPGWHWLRDCEATDFVGEWDADAQRWYCNDGLNYAPEELADARYAYLRPVAPSDAHAELLALRAVNVRTHEEQVLSEVAQRVIENALRRSVTILPDPRDAELQSLRTRLSAVEAERDAATSLLVEDEVAACKNCGGREWPKEPNCPGCTDAVKERVHAAMPRPATLTPDAPQ